MNDKSDDPFVKKEQRSLLSLIVITTVVMAGAMLITLLLGTVLFASPMIIASVGIGFATLILSAAWAVLGPGPFMKRGAGAAIAGSVVAMPIPILFTVAAGDPTMGAYTFLFMLATGPILWVAAQIPFWFMRVFRGWRLGLQSERDPAFTIVDVMAFTGLIACALGAAQPSSSFASTFQEVNDQFLFNVLPFVGITFLFSLVLGLPAIALMLKPRKHTDQKAASTPPSGCGGFFLVTVGICFVLVIGTMIAIGITESDPSIMIVAFAASGLVLCAALFTGAPLVGFFDNGLRLYRVGQSSTVEL